MGAIAVGLVGGEVITADPAAARSETIPVQSLSFENSTLLSFDLSEFLGNVFRYIQVSNISDAEEVNIGQRINQMLLSQQYDLYSNQQVQSYVNRVGQRLVSASDSRDIPFKFQVVESQEINAFAVPGGFIYVTTGLLQAAENEAQLASVLAHEISHINERHSVQAIRRAVLAQGIAETANIESSTLAQIGYRLAVELPRSREFEYAADQGGLRIMRQAGYPPMAFIEFLNMLESTTGTPEFLRTHPTSANRIQELRQEIESSNYSSDRGRREAVYEEAIAPLQ